MSRRIPTTVDGRAPGGAAVLPQEPSASPPPPHVAVVDDDCAIRELLAHYLRDQGLRVSTAASGSALAELMDQDAPDLVLLDLGLPGEDGLALARELVLRRQSGVMIVSGRAAASDRIAGMELGVDDYITKPFELRELVARVRAVLRRTEQRHSGLHHGARNGSEGIRVGGWTIDQASRLVIDPDGRPRELTSGEFDLLCVLAGRAGRVLSRNLLVDRTRGLGAMISDRSIDVQVSRLRRKLGGHPALSIVAVRNAGYKLVVAEGTMPFHPRQPPASIGLGQDR